MNAIKCIFHLLRENNVKIQYIAVCVTKIGFLFIFMLYFILSWQGVGWKYFVEMVQKARIIR